MTAMSEEKLIWHPAGIYKGVFDGFLILANRKVDGSGMQTAWNVTSFNNSGDDGQRLYWVVDGEFRKTLTQTLDANEYNVGVTIEFTAGETIEEAPDAERKAILKAIEEWSEREPDVP
jgi:hypothetical protein